MTERVSSEAIRQYVLRRLIEPARRRGEPRVTVQVGDVHRALGLENRVPLVCSALKARTHWKPLGVRIVAVEGPPSGQSTTVKITYEFSPEAPALSDRPLRALGGLRGIGKQLFAQLGGGEAFIRQMRERFFSTDPTYPAGANLPRAQGGEKSTRRR